MERVHSSGAGDRLEVEAGGAVLIEAGGALRVAQGAIVEVPEQLEAFSTEAFTLSPYQAFRYLTTTSDNPVSITVPPDADVDVPIGAAISVEQGGAGQVTFVAGSGVTIRTPETLKLAKQYAVGTLVKKAANQWTLAGNLEAAP